MPGWHPAFRSGFPDRRWRPISRSFDIVDLKQYFHIVVKRIWLVALCFVISLAVTVVNLVRQVPVFRSTTPCCSAGSAPARDGEAAGSDVLIGDIMDTQTRIDSVQPDHLQGA
jgi:hypothetical protein